MVYSYSVMKSIIQFLSVCLSLTLISCQSQPESNLLVEIVDDYLNRQMELGHKYYNSQYDPLKEGDSIFLVVTFLNPENRCNEDKFKRADGSLPDVAVEVVGNINKCLYPILTFARPLPLSHDSTKVEMKEEYDYSGDSTIWDQYDEWQYRYWEYRFWGRSFEKFFTREEDFWKYQTERYNNLCAHLESTSLVHPDVMGYTLMGPIHILIRKDNVDSAIVEHYLKGLNIMDIRPRFRRDRECYEDYEYQYFGYGWCHIYALDSLSNFSYCGNVLID